MTPEQDQLLSGYLDGNLTTEQKDALQDLLRNSAVARKKLRILSTVTEGLSDHQGHIENKVEPLRKPILSSLIPWSIATVASVFAVIGWMDRSTPESQSENTAKNSPPSQHEPLLALLVDEVGAKFAGDKSPDEVRFIKGNYQLQEGAAHMRFSNGADVVIKAPASFTIDDAFHVRLHHGDMRAIVPPSGHGFTIATPGVDYEDIGTEFALSVNPNKGINQLHVIDGQVDAKHPDSNKLISSITEGQSVQFTDGSLEVAETPDLSQFPTPSAIGFHSWQQQQADFRENNPDLIGYYPFIKSNELINKATNPIAGNGIIQGARWVSGRWSGKDALIFDRDTDFVELDIPGEYTEMTFSAWIKLDRLDYNHNSIFSSNGWDRGDVHWTIHRHGQMAIGYHGGNTTSIPSTKSITTNQWIHLAGTISSNSQKTCVYLNGKLLSTSPIDPKRSIQPGIGRIGNWLKGDREDPAPMRAMRGKMDELAIWKRALTEQEIKKLAKNGRPSTLWQINTQ